MDRLDQTIRALTDTERGAGGGSAPGDRKYAQDAQDTWKGQHYD